MLQNNYPVSNNNSHVKHINVHINTYTRMNNHHNNEKDLERRLTCDSAFIMENSGGT